MWPFTSRGSRAGTTAPEPSDLPPFEQFAHNDARLKIWLTEPLSERINWLSNKLDASRPDVLRALMFEHLYGRVAYEALEVHVRQQKSAHVMQRSRQAIALRAGTGNGIDAALHGRPADKGVPRYSARDVTPIDIRFTGKASDDFTLELPNRLKEDLTAIARKHDLTPSSYARKMLVLQLLGECVHTDWQKAIGKLPPDVLHLERD